VRRVSDDAVGGPLGTGHAANAPAEGVRILLDAGSLRVGFVASLGPFPVRGEFTDVRGVLEIPLSGIEGATLTAEVGAASLDTGLAMRDRHLRGRSFLDASHFPRITYVNHLVTHDNGDLIVGGSVTLRGRTREVRTRCTLSKGGDGGAERIVLSATLDIPCREHGVGVPLGLDRLNPIFLVVGARVQVNATITVPANRLLPSLLPALGR
jgi:polyisoprenoid-binding protein YceI